MSHIKSPLAAKNYGFDWSQEYPGDSISGTPVVTVIVGTATVSAVAVNGLIVTYQLTGGADGERDVVQCVVVFASGQTDAATDEFLIVNEIP